MKLFYWTSQENETHTIFLLIRLRNANFKSRASKEETTRH